MSQPEAEEAASSGRTAQQQALIAIVQVLALAVWFSASAVVPALQQEWGITALEAVWLTASTQIGFVIGAVSSAVLNLADRVPVRLLLAASAALAAVCTALLAVLPVDYPMAIVLRALTGVCLAGVYPVGMKMMVSWSAASRRGLLMGILLAALTLGSSIPHLLGTLPMAWRPLLGAGAGLTMIGALLALGARPGPHLQRSRSRLQPGYVLEMFRDPVQRRVNLGYFGHMWELYALWTWAPLFVIASGAAEPSSAALGLGVFLAMGVAGVAGCIAGGWAADRWGRRVAARTALAVSGLCCLASPFAFSLPWPVLLAFGCVWGASVIADSGVFSTMLSEATEQRYVGTALTAQTAIGFLLTVVSIQLIPLVAAATGWQFAFLVLVLGPVAGVIAFSRAAGRRGTQQGSG